jgi:hypothetical protein
MEMSTGSSPGRGPTAAKPSREGEEEGGGCVYVGADGDWNAHEGKDGDDAMAVEGMESGAETRTSSLFQSEGELLATRGVSVVPADKPCASRGGSVNFRSHPHHLLAQGDYPA